MTVPLDEQEGVGRMDGDGIPRARIARELRLSRNAVARYADIQDMSPRAPVSKGRARRATDGIAPWIDAMLQADLLAPKKQRHTALRILDRAVEERGHAGSYSSIRGYVAAWKAEHAQGPGEGFLELVWTPGTAQVDFGDLAAKVAGTPVALKLLVVSFPRPNARFCAGLPCEKAEVFCWGLRVAFEWAGRAARLLVPDNATEAGRMVFGKVVESKPFAQFGARHRCESRHRDPYSGNERALSRTPWGP